MAGDVRETFPITEDATTGAGLNPTSRVEGDAAAAMKGLIGFAFKDSSGNVILPQLTSEGKLPVDFASAGVPKSAQCGTAVAGSLTQVLVCEVALTISKTYGKISARGACFREAIFQLIQLNDVTSTVLDEFIVGPGQFSYEIQMGALEILTGGTGTQKLQLKAKNLDKASDFRGSLSALEYAV